MDVKRVYGSISIETPFELISELESFSQTSILFIGSYPEGLSSNPFILKK